MCIIKIAKYNKKRRRKPLNFLFSLFFIIPSRGAYHRKNFRKNNTVTVIFSLCFIMVIILREHWITYEHEDKSYICNFYFFQQQKKLQNSRKMHPVCKTSKNNKWIKIKNETSVLYLVSQSVYLLIYGF